MYVVLVYIWKGDKERSYFLFTDSKSYLKHLLSSYEVCYPENLDFNDDDCFNVVSAYIKTFKQSSTDCTVYIELFPAIHFIVNELPTKMYNNYYEANNRYGVVDVRSEGKRYLYDYEEKKFVYDTSLLVDVKKSSRSIIL